MIRLNLSSQNLSYFLANLIVALVVQANDQIAPVDLASTYLLKISAKPADLTDQRLATLQQHTPFKLRYRASTIALVEILLSHRHETNTIMSVVSQLQLRLQQELGQQKLGQASIAILDQQSASATADYYLLDIDLLPKLSDQVVVIDIFDDAVGQVALVRADQPGELRRLPVHFRAKLPADISLELRFEKRLALAPQAEVDNLLQQVSVKQWRDLIQTMTLNEDLLTAGHRFLSRYALRVHQAVQHDGQPKPDIACDNSADWIAQKFQRLGLEVEIDSFQHARSQIGKGKIGDYTMRNVVATLPGRGPHKDQVYLLTAHYDSIASKTEGWEQQWRTMPAPGSSDNASGVAILLETARLIRHLDLDYSVRFIAFSGEELFLYGSRYYCDLVQSQRSDLSADQIAGVLNFDLIGHDQDGRLDIHVVHDERSRWIAQVLHSVTEKYGLPLDLRLQYNPGFIYSDHSPFWEIGIPAVLLSEESAFNSRESIKYIHSQADNMEKITDPLGELALKLAVATTVELAGVGDSAATQPVAMSEKLLWNVILFPNPVNLAHDQSLSLDYFLSQPARIQIDLYNTNGQKVYEQNYRLGKIGGKQGRNGVFRWNGRANTGNRIASGVYLLRVTATPASGESEIINLQVALVH